MKLREFLALSSPEQYDFKDLMEQYYWHCADHWVVEKGKSGAKNFEDLVQNFEDMVPDLDAVAGAYLSTLQELKKMHTDDSIKKWYLYKTIDRPIREKNKSIQLFDCDSWNGTCDLTDEIYKTLWRKKELPWNVSFQGKIFGGDTINSFAYTFGAFSGTQSYGSSYERYERDPAFQEAASQILGEYARRVGWIGNFILVPHGYSGYRGDAKHPMKDYWDLSLDNLKYNKYPQAQDPEVKSPEAQTDWLGAVRISFERYINTFFLWDYVDDQYQVMPLFAGHADLMGEGRVYQNALPSKGEVQTFADNANLCILRRGIFMVAMLRIAADPQCGDAYQKKIIPCLAKDGRLGTMEQVLDNLKDICKPDNKPDEHFERILEILTEASEKLAKQKRPEKENV